MKSDIRICGIKTNNLKNINISLKKHAINLIVGPSGSGKSSLAYDTIAQIGIHEYKAMFVDDVVEPDYIVESYDNMCVTVPLRQTNYNSNPRSTIGTYFGLNRKLISIFSSILGVSDSYFSLYFRDNVCEDCHGSGYISVPDINKIVNFRTPINENPFRCWKRYSDFYSKILQKYCDEVKIDSTKTFEELSEEQRKLLLYGEGSEKYQIKYTHGTNISSRTTRYYGVMTGKPMRKKNYKLPQSYYSEVHCPSCRGMKLGHEQLTKKVWGLSIGEILNMPFSKLSGILLAAEKEHNNKVIKLIRSLQQFVDKSNELYLGHLSLNRTIPSLSGGELQRLRMVKLFTTQLLDLLIVLDEPLTGMSGDEKKIVYENIINLIPKHTLVIVDHSSAFLKNARNIIALGNAGGVYGGLLIDAKKYLQSQQIDITVAKESVKVIESIHSKIHIYGFSGCSIRVAIGSMNLIKGKSGIGKSTLLREYFARYFDDYTYINQKAIEGNVNSCVATLLDIANPILKMYADKYKIGKDFFSNASGKEGACPICLGTGYCKYGSLKLKCDACKGTGFNEKLKKYTIRDRNIFDIWNMTIDEGYEFFKNINRKIFHKLDIAKQLQLGYLQIGQFTNTLSGGENVRLKILKVDQKEAKIIGIDEPFKGLNNLEISAVLEYLIGLRDQGKTIIIVDQTDFVSMCFDYVINLQLTDKYEIRSY